MKLSKCELFDMLAFDNKTLKEKDKQLYEKKQALLREISDHITEDSHIEIKFVSEVNIYEY